MKNDTRITPSAGAMVKTEFGGQTLAVSASLAAEASIAAVQAQIQARCVMAERHPRDWDLVRQKLLRACERPGFAESAIYTLPWAKDKNGKPVQGLSIRFAEEAMRDLGNVYPQSRVIFEDEAKRIISVSVTELEGNVTVEKEIIVEKTVERNHVKDGQVVLRERTNSSGKKTFLVIASEGEMAAKQASAESKAMRTAILRILPGDLQDEAWSRLEATALNQAAKDPSAQKKKLLDAFLAFGVTADEVKAYVGHSLDQLPPKTVVELQRVYAGVRDGELSWAEALEAKLSQRKGEVVEPKTEQPAASAATVESKPVEKPVEAKEEPKKEGAEGVGAPLEANAPETPSAPESQVASEPKPTPPPANTSARADIMDAFRQLAQAKAHSPRLLGTICQSLLKAADAEMTTAVKAEFKRLSDQLTKETAK